MADYSYKPALLRGVRNYTLNDEHLICSDSDGVEKWRLDWSKITGAAFVELKVKASRIRRLDLLGDVKQSISYTGGPGDPAHDPEAVEHLDLLAAILARLDPDMPVAVEEYGRSRWAMFIVGVFSICTGLGLLVLALATGVSGDRLGAMVVPVALLALMGIALARSYAPWRPVAKLPAATLSKVLAQTARPETGQVD